MYTHIEDYINELYKHLSITTPEQIDIEMIASKLGICLSYGIASFRYENDIVIQRSTNQKEWQTFGHEVCHYLRHSGYQIKMHPLFRELQEYQANYFAYHFCVPTFMLDKINNVTAKDIMNLFNVESDFAFRRLEIYKNSRRFLSWPTTIKKEKDMQGPAVMVAGN